MASREAIGEQRFFDIGQPQLVNDPLGSADRIYDFADLELRPDVREAMGSWSVENQTGSRGAHSYSAEEFGLSEAEIGTKFAEYIDRYQQYWTAL